jgi:hypothetical protein
MKPLTKALAVAGIQVLLVCSLGAKLLYDRQTRPQAWFKAERYDPNLPIRGRYLSLQFQVSDPRTQAEVEAKFHNEIQMQETQQARFNLPDHYDFGRECGSIALQGSTPVAQFDGGGNGWNCDNLRFVHRKTDAGIDMRLDEQVLFFIPDTAPDVTHLKSGEELWVLATIPRQGPPRPIALGIKHAGDSTITPVAMN